ncbi:hypothetical protein CDAR_519351 [Caerostris darwini]|uniref:EGF-like domain-containing protein n=1 Tax=Caerostris darwini TaxID=1538125 RepID=A0AAV4PN08_9ARAC|nr:hypothetical protein CDAR_519351 [Caerostris darwini]
MFWLLSVAKCGLDCGNNGQCEEGRCRCDSGWSGSRCDQKTCDERCHDHGQCNNGTCVCVQGWMGTHCTLGKNLNYFFDLQTSENVLVINTLNA